MGCRVSLDCGGLGYFQGVICRISYNDQTVTLEKPFQNGLACKFPEITINSTDITVIAISRPLLLHSTARLNLIFSQDLKILKSKEEVQAEAAAKVSSSSIIKVQVKKKSKPGGQQQQQQYSGMDGGGDHSR